MKFLILVGVLLCSETWHFANGKNLIGKSFQEVGKQYVVES